jgi:adenylate cyclase
MVYSGTDDLDNLTAVEESKPLLAPSLVYHLRKLFRQNLDRLIATDGALPLDPTDDMNVALGRLYPSEEQRKGIISKLERLTIFHQTLSNQGSQHIQQLRETEEQIFTLFGLQLGLENHIGTILVVDDNITDVDLLSSAFAKQTYRVLVAHSDAKAIEMAHEQQPDLILLDMLVAGVDGVQICRNLKANPNTQDIPVILTSALNGAQLKVASFGAGGADFINKPFQIEEVLVRVEHQINLRNLQKRLEEQNVRLQQEMHERQQLEEQYRNIFESSIDGIFQSTEDGQFKSVNQALAHIYGYESTDALMAGITNIAQQLYVHPSRRDGLNAYLKQHGQVVGAESRIYRRDGSKIWISENIRSVCNAKGEFLYYEGTVRDVTERRRMESALRHQRQETERLLLSILPQSVAERLRDRREIIVDSFEDVTVLYADIDGFTAFCNHISPSEQIKLLSRLFSNFDAKAEELGLEKIKTIRDVYLIAGGVHTEKSNHAEAIADMALAMQMMTEEIERDLGEPFRLRIGISTGAAISGVIGLKKITYDLWGNAVNLASRMQATGAPGRIQVTPATYRRLVDQFTFEERGMTEIYGIGPMMTYWLQGRIEKRP